MNIPNGYYIVEKYDIKGIGQFMYMKLFLQGWNGPIFTADASNIEFIRFHDLNMPVKCETINGLLYLSEV